MRKERLAGHTKLDLAKYYVAVAEGALRGAARASLGALPLSLVPTFAVPLWTIFHAISLLQLRHAIVTIEAAPWRSRDRRSEIPR